MKCESCEKELCVSEIQNYTITYECDVSYNCCCLDCALDIAKKEYDLKNEDILSVEF